MTSSLGPTGDQSWPPGWYEDPWRLADWRWWDGETWSAHVQTGAESRPRLPSWLSVPVLVCTCLTVLILLGLLVAQTESTLVGMVLGLFPLLIVFPVLTWLDRVEPEPLGARIHAMLWGATVAGVISLVVNTLVATTMGEAWAVVVSAPVIEEITKGVGIYWALRRREIDGVMDGIIYAGWVALGFACIEDVNYFANAAAFGNLTEVFVVRALLTPFAHPLFSAWIGLAIGLAVARRQSVALNALWGLGLAIASHATWNATLLYTDETGGVGALVFVAVCFVALFVAAAVTVVLIRRAEQRHFVRLIPLLAQRHGLSASEVGIFGDWHRILATRRSLPRDQRAAFDRMHAALARLALFHRRGAGDQATEALLSNQLTRARREATSLVASAR